jgi:hypothetical protein
MVCTWTWTPFTFYAISGTVGLVITPKYVERSILLCMSAFIATRPVIPFPAYVPVTIRSFPSVTNFLTLPSARYLNYDV